MNNERKEFTFLWYIENYSYCTQKNEEELISPEFTADSLEGTAWTLQLYPRGELLESKGYISLYLNRSENDDGPEDFPLKYEMSILAIDGSTLKGKEFEYTFKKGEGYGNGLFLQLDEILLRRKSDYLPQDILSVHCKIKTGEVGNQQIKEITSRTRIRIEQISFHHEIERFSSIEPNEKKIIQIKSPSKKGLAFSSSVYVSGDSCWEEKIIVEIIPSSVNHTLSKCGIALLDSSGKSIKCGESDNRLEAERNDVQKLPLSFTRTGILKRKSEYLFEDKLFLLCECIFSTGVEFEKIEKTVYEYPFVSLNQKGNYDKDIYAEKLSECPGGLDDLKEIYNDRLLTDVELKTKTKSFPAHKIVLCARSSVFKAMLTNDMKEKNTDCIQIDDLEEDTVQQLLIFIYSDNIEHLEWQSTVKLYYAGDKYAIEKLKLLCTSFLVHNITPSNAGELLLLADTHNDSNLKNLVEDFIFQHEKQVFRSEEWINLIETNPVLVSKTMCLKYTREL